MPHILTVVGARPQFVKAATVSKALQAAGLDEDIVHTGQHYDWNMSQAFFDGLDIPAPAVNLNVGSGPHGRQTGRMLEGLEGVITDRQPDLVLVYGDTNSTMAGALAASKLHVPVAHVEAGLRSFNRHMPEEINRVVTDHLSSLLFAPTATAVENLAAEGIGNGVIRTGDVMYDLSVDTEQTTRAMRDRILGQYGVTEEEYALVTMHRAENTENPGRWEGITSGIRQIVSLGLPVIWPAHPRTRAKVAGLNDGNLHIVEPLPYLDTQTLIRFARVVITDSGGVQKEAAFRKTPCRTVRTETEWTELLECGVNRLVPADAKSIADACLGAMWPDAGMPEHLYGDGRTSHAIAAAIMQAMKEN